MDRPSFWAQREMHFVGSVPYNSVAYRFRTGWTEGLAWGRIRGEQRSRTSVACRGSVYQQFGPRAFCPGTGRWET